jgi:hypothetical protein
MTRAERKVGFGVAADRVHHDGVDFALNAEQVARTVAMSSRRARRLVAMGVTADPRGAP